MSIITVEVPTAHAEALTREAAFRPATTATFDENAELYRRLAD